MGAMIEEPEGHVVELEAACYTIVYRFEPEGEAGTVYSVRFELYPQLGMAIPSVELADVIGFIKWDGCSDWNAQDGGSIHFCGCRNVVNLMNAISACYHIAGKYMPEANE